MTDQTVGERLRRFRIEILGMSQLELAAKIGIDPASLNRIERGKRRPDHNTYTLLATRTVISMDWLLTGDGPMRRAHYEPDPTDWPLIDEAIRELCRFADDNEIDPDKCVDFIRLAYQTFAKRADITPEQRREQMRRMLRLTS